MTDMRIEDALAEIERLRALSQNNAHSWDAIVKVRNDLRAENERLRALLERCRPYVANASSWDGGLIASIDAALEPKP